MLGLKDQADLSSLVVTLELSLATLALDSSSLGGLMVCSLCYSVAVTGFYA